MGKKDFLPPFTWQGYSRKLKDRIIDCCHSGILLVDAKRSPEMRYVFGKEGSAEENNAVCMYLLIDETDGIIADARFQAFGPSVLIGFAETVCELILRKNYDQAMRINADYVEKYLQDRKNIQPFPNDTAGYLNIVLSALEEAVAKCYDIPIENPSSTPLNDYHNISEEENHPDFLNYTEEEKRRVLEKVLSNDIRPYIELDAGGVEIVQIKDQKQVIIRYEGACVSCYSATGATLESIQNILRMKIHPAIEVIPDLTMLSS
ncbi:MAG: hypothetical protein Tsb0015_06170 [Simkaniaceae bacterium]